MRLLTDLLSPCSPRQELRWSSFQLKLVFAMGAGLWVLSGAIFLLLPQNLHGLVYLLAALVGIGNAFMLVCIFPRALHLYFIYPVHRLVSTVCCSGSTYPEVVIQIEP